MRALHLNATHCRENEGLHKQNSGVACITSDKSYCWHDAGCIRVHLVNKLTVRQLPRVLKLINALQSALHDVRHSLIYRAKRLWESVRHVQPNGRQMERLHDGSSHTLPSVAEPLPQVSKPAHVVNFRYHTPRIRHMAVTLCACAFRGAP